MPGNSLARDCVSGRFPEWDLEYRVARDGIAYNRLEFKAYYGCERFRRYWEEATFATPLDKHQALLSALRLRCDCMRMTKVAEALWKAHVFDDRILDLICSFGVGHTISSVYYITSSGVKIDRNTTLVCSTRRMLSKFFCRTKRTYPLYRYAPGRSSRPSLRVNCESSMTSVENRGKTCAPRKPHGGHGRGFCVVGNRLIEDARDGSGNQWTLGNIY